MPLTLEFIDPRPKTRRFTKWKIQSLGQINPIKNFSRGLTEKSVIQEKMGEEGKEKPVEEAIGLIGLIFLF